MSNYQIYTGEIKIKQPKIKVRIYHDTQGEALNHLQEVLFQMGYTITEFEGIEHVAYGTTNRYQFPLHSEDPKNKSKVVLVQLYRMDSGRYELNFYTNR